MGIKMGSGSESLKIFIITPLGNMHPCTLSLLSLSDGATVHKDYKIEMKNAK